MDADSLARFCVGVAYLLVPLLEKEGDGGDSIESRKLLKLLFKGPHVFFYLAPLKSVGCERLSCLFPVSCLFGILFSCVFSKEFVHEDTSHLCLLYQFAYNTSYNFSLLYLGSVLLYLTGASLE